MAKALNSGADSGDRASGLVSKDARSGMRSAMDLLEVRAADAARMHPDEDLAGADLRHRNGFDTHVVQRRDRPPRSWFLGSAGIMADRSLLHT